MTASSGIRRRKGSGSPSTKRSSGSSPDPTVTFSDKERAKGKPTRAHLAAARQAFLDDGFAQLEGALERALVLELRRAYYDRFGGCSEEELAGLGSKVGHERWMLSLPLEAPFDDPGLLAPALVHPLLTRLLGPDFMLHSLSAVTSFPGAEHQHVHLDHELLFPEDEDASFDIPPYAVTAVVPLANLDARLGGTSVWPASHKARPPLLDRLRRPVPLRPQLGSLYLMDYRLMHGGEPNVSAVPRPVLYLVYTRPWFKDACNFNRHPPLRADADLLARLPKRLHHLFVHDPAAG